MSSPALSPLLLLPSLHCRSYKVYEYGRVACEKAPLAKKRRTDRGGTRRDAEGVLLTSLAIGHFGVELARAFQNIFEAVRL